MSGGNGPPVPPRGQVGVGGLVDFLPFWINGAGEDETGWLARLAGCYRIAGWVCAILVVGGCRFPSQNEREPEYERMNELMGS